MRNAFAKLPYVVYIEKKVAVLPAPDRAQTDILVDSHLTVLDYEKETI